MTVAYQTSQTIKACRVLCITLMMYVHVNPGLGNFKGQLDAPLSWLEYGLVELLGRASVPALTLISGYLIVSALERHRYAGVVAGRFRSVVVPMVAWNALMVGLALAIFLLTGERTSLLQPLLEADLASIVLVKVLALSNSGATHALNFLRDLFVCVLLSPAIVWLIRRGGALGAGLITTLCLFVDLDPIVYRSSLPLFYAWGVWLALRGSTLQPTRRTSLAFGLTLAALAALELAVDVRSFLGFPYAHELYDAARRAIVAGAFIGAAHWIARRRRLYAWIQRAEPSIYLAFLSHSAVMLLMWGPWGKVFGTDLAFPYPLFFGLAPLAVVALCVAVDGPIGRAPRWLQMLVRGKVRAPRSPRSVREMGGRSGAAA